MPTFTYVVKDRTGQTHNGSLDIESRQALIERFWDQDFVVLSIKERPLRTALVKVGQPKVSAKELVVFSRQLATMVSSGIPIIGALDVLAEPVKDHTFRDTLRKLRDDVEGGTSLSQAARRHPAVFSDFFVNMIEAGESSGRLDEILDRQATYLEKTDTLRRKVQASLVYPALVSCLALCVTAFLVLVVVPKFKDIFASFGERLPLATRILLGTSDVLRQYLVLEFLLVFFGIVGFRLWIKTPAGRMWFDQTKLRLPIFGELFQKVAIARFARTLSTLVRSGVPILTSLEIVAKIVGNAAIESAVLRARASIKEGDRIADPLADSQVFPTMVTRMIAVGEKTGEFEQMLSKIADFYESEVDTAISGLMTLIEPLVISLLGVVVGAVAVALLLPVFTIPHIVGTH